MSAFDGNHDGRMNIQERLDGLEFHYADRDNDGVMNRKEFARVENEVEFNRYDKNRDGLVDAPEYAHGEAQERQSRH